MIISWGDDRMVLSEVATAVSIDAEGDPSAHDPRSFTLILGGGGARGFAHAGVLRALERRGWYPSAIVGVSMGAVVGATYALREDWFEALLSLDAGGFPGPVHQLVPSPGPRPSTVERLVSGAKALWSLGRGWGDGNDRVEASRAALHSLLGGKDLADGRIPVAVSATDLLSGERVVIRSGPAAEAVYASSALAGLVPPEPRGHWLLADGAYTDICPIDVARQYGHDAVVAVNPGRSEAVEEIRSGLDALVRATEICYLHHATLRFDEADVVLLPRFRRAIDTLDFAASRECVAAGIRAVRAEKALDRVLGAGSWRGASIAPGPGP
jgi:NTE family protein